MASTSNPFADPEPNKSLPLLPPSLSITLPTPVKGASPSTEDAIYENENEENHFADLPRPSTAEDLVVPRGMPHPRCSQLQSARSGVAPGSSTLRGDTAIRDFGPTMSGGLTAARQGEKKARSARSGEGAAPSHLMADSTLVSSVRGGAATNPFADPVYLHPQPRDASRKAPLPDQLSNSPNGHLSPSPSPSPNIGSSPLSFMGPTPPLKSSRQSGQRLTSLGSFTSRFGIRPSSAHTSNYSLGREAIARESARRQEERLQTARAQQFNASLSNINEPRLRPSPSALRVAAELIRARDSSVAYGSQAVLSSVPFWISIFLLQTGLVSTSASAAVIVQGQSHSTKVYVGAGRVFWLVISCVILVLGGVSAWIIWMRKKGISFVGGDRAVLRRLGCDEVGLLDRAIAQDITMGRMDDSSMGPDLERGSIASPCPSSNRTYRPRQMPGLASMGSVVTKDPTWHALYATPQQLRQMVSQETIREESDDGGTPVRMGGAESMLGKDEESIKHFNARSPVKALDPQLTRSNTSWPLRSTPQPAPFVKTHPERAPTAPPAQFHSPETAVLAGTAPRHQALSSGINPPTRRRTSSTTGDASSRLNPSAPRHRAGSRVEIQSPLAVLTHTLASAESLPIQHRLVYLHQRRVAGEERASSLRESLELVEPSMPHGLMRSSNTFPLTPMARHGIPEAGVNSASRSNLDSRSAVGDGEENADAQGRRRPRPRSHSAGEIFTVDEFLSLSSGSSGSSCRSSRARKRDLTVAEFLQADTTAHGGPASAEEAPHAASKPDVQPGGKSEKAVARAREKIGRLKDAEVLDAGAGAGSASVSSSLSPTSTLPTLSSPLLPSPRPSPSALLRPKQADILTKPPPSSPAPGSYTSPSPSPSPNPSPRPSPRAPPAPAHAESPVFVIGEDSPRR